MNNCSRLLFGSCANIPLSQKTCKCLTAFALLLRSEIANQRRFRINPGCSAKQPQNQFVVWFKIIVVWVDKLIVVWFKRKVER